MSTVSSAVHARISLPLRFLAGVLAVLLATLASFYLVMRPPFGDLRAMATFLTITAGVSLVVGYLAYRGGWLARAPRLSWALLGICALSSILTFLNVWVTARLMFASEHDLALATVLLMFAGGIAMVLGYFLSVGITDRIRTLCMAAEDVAAGRLGTRVAVSGRDEMAELGHAFNAMSDRLATAAARQREFEILRRDLIAWAGHDLRTPLASMRAIVEALADGVVEDAAERERYLRIAQRDVRSLSRLIDDLFELAELDAGGLKLERQRGSLGDLISDTLEGFSTRAQQQQVTLRGSADPLVDPVLMDSGKIGRALANLIGNALDYTPSGGTIDVTAQAEAGAARVRVRDTGAGIDPGDLPRVFERFYRGEKSRSRASGGSGLGLAIAKGIIEAHGGHIWVESAPGQGAVFTFTLPK